MPFVSKAQLREAQVKQETALAAMRDSYEMMLNALQEQVVSQQRTINELLDRIMDRHVRVPAELTDGPDNVRILYDPVTGLVSELDVSTDEPDYDESTE